MRFIFRLLVFVLISQSATEHSIYAQELVCLSPNGSAEIDYQCLDEQHLAYCNLLSDFDTCFEWMDNIIY